MTENQSTPVSSPKAQEFHLPSPLPTKRSRTLSQCQRAHAGPVYKGTVKSFSREKGHGFIQMTEGGSPIFVHISDIESDYALKEGDEVTFKLCPIPPKMEKYSAVHVFLVHPKEGVSHEKWDNTHIHHD